MAGTERSSLRDRRGRGMRGPGVLPRVPGQPVLRTKRQRFDDLALSIIAELDERLHDRLGLVEYAVEDAPQIPYDWGEATVPLSSLVRGRGSNATRLVLFRRPIEHRCKSRIELEAMLWTVIVEQLAELLGMRPDDIDPNYEP